MPLFEMCWFFTGIAQIALFSFNFCAPSDGKCFSRLWKNVFSLARNSTQMTSRWFLGLWFLTKWKCSERKICTQMNFVRTLGTEFTRSRKTFPTETTGDTVRVKSWIEYFIKWILWDITDNLSGGERGPCKVETLFSFGRWYG